MPYERNFVLSQLLHGRSSVAALAALEETDAPELFLVALRDVAEAQGIAHVAENANLNRENLYKMLSEDGNPTLKSLYSILDVFGLKLSIESKDECRKAS